MEWDWKTEAYTALKWIGAFLATWGANYVRKKVKPFFKNVKSFLGLNSKTELLEAELKKAAKKAEIHENLFLAKLKIDENPIFINDNKGNLVFVNDAWLRMTGFNNPEDAYGEGYLLAIPESDRDKIANQARRYAQHPAPFSGYIPFINIHTEEKIRTFCRSEVVYTDGVYEKSIGRLDILSVTPKESSQHG